MTIVSCQLRNNVNQKYVIHITNGLFFSLVVHVMSCCFCFFQLACLFLFTFFFSIFCPFLQDTDVHQPSLAEIDLALFGVINPSTPLIAKVVSSP